MDLNKNLPLGATPLDDISELIPAFITTKQELYDAEFKNINLAELKYLFSAKNFSLNLNFLYQVHKEMFAKVWKWAGKRRRTNLNIGSDKLQIEIDLKNLLDDLKYWEAQKFDLVDIATFLHHRLVKIHPFYNGNGRWARLIINIYLKAKLNRILRWEENRLSADSNFRLRYIKALQEADKGDYKFLKDIMKNLMQAEKLSIILATNNQHKIQEIKAIFGDLGLEVLGYQDILHKNIDVVEDGVTFAENAQKKVAAFPDLPNCIFLADDSGLEVQALDGAPGVYSARYAGGDTSPLALCTKLLAELKGKKNRAAQFHSVIALKFPQNKIKIVHGLVHGQITTKMQGTNGFGYDPIFMPKGFTKTFAEMNSQEKNGLSHRFLALQKARLEIQKVVPINVL